jgi:hypothetical protein
MRAHCVSHRAQYCGAPVKQTSLLSSRFCICCLYISQVLYSPASDVFVISPLIRTPKVSLRLGLYPLTEFVATGLGMELLTGDAH